MLLTLETLHVPAGPFCYLPAIPSAPAMASVLLSRAKPQSPRPLPSASPRLAVPPPPRPLGLGTEEVGRRECD